MIDFNKIKSIVIPEGNVVKITAGGVALWQAPAACKNWVPLSIDTDGNIFNGVGYQDGYRLSSSGAAKEYQSSVVTGYIPTAPGDTIRIYGADWYEPSISINYLCAYDADFGFIGALTPENGGYTYGAKIFDSISQCNDFDVMITLAEAEVENIAYIRVSTVGRNIASALPSGDKIIITVNEEIEQSIP